MSQNNGNNKKTSGILRTDTNDKSRRLSGSSVEFKLQPELLGYEPTSPASSNYAIIASPQLSVRFANQTDQDTSDNSRVEQLSEDQSICLSPLIKDNNRENFPSEANSSEKYNKTNKSAFLTAPRKKKSRKNLWLSLQESDDFFYRCDKESPIYMEPISPLNLPEINSDEDDYSVSVSAIMQRRLSTKRASRKGKSRKSVTSPLDLLEQKDRRRSSVYTTSSGDTAITMEETNNQDSSQEQIFENIRIHKEVLQQVKWQPWTMKRKLRLVQQAKNYIARHEGELQERFASSRSTRDILARFKIVIGTWFAQKWQHTKRELANLSTWLIPWELRIKEIESHFGSVVASYFTFLRWLFWVNIVIAVVLIVFLAVPELITMDMNTTDRRKKMSAEEEAIAGKLITIWEFEGFLKYSPLFYGYYTKEKYSGIMWWYNLPLAYFLTGVAVYIYSFYATLQKMAENSRMSKLSSKDDECTFSWKIFTGWDFMIGHAETAQNRLSSVILGFKEALLEESEKKKDARNWKIICLRIFVNLVVLALLIISAVAVILVVQDSKQVTDQSGWFKRNEITLVLSAISFFFPMFFESLGILEYYHPRKQLRIQLARIMVLNLLNLYSLIFALFDKISYMSDDSQKLRKIIEPPLSNGFETATMMAMSSITPEQAITAITTVATILTSILNTKQNKSAMTTTTEMPGKLTTFYDGIEASTPYDLELDENRNIISEKTTSEENFILTTTPIYLETEETPIGSQNNEYDPSDEHYYLYTDEELKKLELEQKTRKKRQISIEPENATTVMFDDDMSNFTMTDDYENMNFTDDALNGTDFNENSTLSMPVTDETTMTGTESDTTTIKTTQLMTSELGTTPSTYFTQTQTIPTTTMLTTTTMMPVEEANRKIRNLCWETMFGQELVKLTVMDLIITIGSTMFLDFFRALFVRYMNGCWCWDLEKQYPQYGDFKIAENILHLVNNQGMVWMGLFFSPGLALINLVKLGILMYLRSWTVLTCNVPHEVVFRASRSNNFYLALLLTMLFLCVLPVSYAIVLLTPSWHCGPFSDHDKIYYLFTNATFDLTPEILHHSIGYLASPAAVIPLLVLLILIIYYLLSLTGSLREANHDLRNQLRKERTEERKKMWKLAEAQTKGPANGANALTARWKKVLEGAQSPSPENAGIAETTADTKVEARKELLAKIMKKALRKGSASDDDSQLTNVGDETDTEAHESLPRDHSPVTKKTPDIKVKRKLKNPFAQIIAMAKEKSALKENSPNGVENLENKENIRKENEKDTENTKKKSFEEEEADEKERIVSERRRSLFKRQENIGAAANDTDDSKKAPELIFKFDESLTQQQSDGKQTENGSKKSKPEKPKRNGSNVKHRCSPHHEIMSDSSSDYPGTMIEKKGESGNETPHYAAPMKIRPVNAEKPVSGGPDGKYTKKKEKDDAKNDDEMHEIPKTSPSKPKRKFNKMFNIEKESKSDQVTPPKSPKSPKSPTVEPIPELPKQESLSSKDSIESSSKDSKTDKKTTKRQDSQTSIWSDNIPVITISKTESNENILEGESGTIKKKKGPKSPKKAE